MCFVFIIASAEFIHPLRLKSFDVWHRKSGAGTVFDYDAVVAGRSDFGPDGGEGGRL